MKLKDVFLLSLTSIQHRHLRSWLTILGIVIGVASIVSLIGLSQGLSASINKSINSVGSNLITITAGGQQAGRVGGIASFRPPEGGAGGGFGGTRSSSTPEITFRDADNLRTLPGVYRVDARLSGRALVQYKNQNSSLSIVGTEPAAFPDSVALSLYSGRFLSSSDQFSAVIGAGVANRTFNDLDMINKQIKIGGTAFRVVGILQSSGGFGGSDNSVYIPLSVAKTMFNQTTDASSVIVVAASDHDPAVVATEVENEFILLHRVTATTEDFTISTAATLQATIATITDTLTLFLGGIAAISLLVGAIGVANTMFMSVMEQTKEIGVLKSLGARSSDVVNLFLCEAAIIGFVGGFLGVVLSFIVAFAMSSLGLPVLLTPELVLGGLLFSVVIGIVAGLVPARNAASIPPVEALRYE